MVISAMYGDVEGKTCGSLRDVSNIAAFSK